MPEPTRRSVLAALGVGLTTGCLTTPGNRTASEKPTPGRSPDESPTTDPTTPETTGDWISRASNTSDPDHGVYLTSESAESRTVRAWVVRAETGETVFDETREIAAGNESEVYNLRRANPDGVEAFRVCGEVVKSTPTETATATGTATADTTTTATATAATTATTGGSETADPQRGSCVTIETSECYGNAYVTVRDDGSLQVIYAIC